MKKSYEIIMNIVGGSRSYWNNRAKKGEQIMDVQVIHKKENWVAMHAWSVERAEFWLSKFNPNMWDDKSLKASDFKIVIK